MEIITNLLSGLNLLANKILPLLAGLALFAFAMHKTIGWIRKEGVQRGVFWGVIILFTETLLAFLFYFLPELISVWTNNHIPPSVWRWFLLFTFIPVILYFNTYKQSGFRGTLVALGHLLILLYGWLLGKWIGVLFVSTPLILAFYWMLWKLSPIILPMSEPDDHTEQRRKFMILFWYLWGLQYPIWKVREKAARNIDLQVKGDYIRDYGEPGLIWTRPHQVVGISTGIEFVEVKGPGLIFTNQYDRPVAVVDLRTQLRTTDLEVVLSDGIQIKAILFVSFSIDHNDWENMLKEKRHELLRTNSLPPNSLKLDHRIGSYPYSASRVRAALSTTDVSIPHPARLNEKKVPTRYWDEWVMDQMEQAAREILSQRSLNGLWEPNDDRSNHSALDEIAVEIRSQMEPRLKCAGIQLLGARVVNYKLSEKKEEEPSEIILSEIEKQQVASWKNIWEDRQTEKIASGEADYESMIKTAHAQARSNFMQSVADSLKNKPDISRQTVALHFLSKLEEFMQQQPSAEGTKLKSQIDSWKKNLVMKGKS
jgi:hypothetical protein